MSKATSTPKRPEGSWVVVPSAQAPAVVDDCFEETLLPDVHEFWTLSAADAEEADRALAALLRTGRSRDNHLQIESEAPIGQYYRKYAGVVWQARRLVHVSGFVVSETERWASHKRSMGLGDFDWKTETVYVCGGGANYFHGVYDLDVHDFIAFRFNAPA